MPADGTSLPPIRPNVGRLAKEALRRAALAGLWLAAAAGAWFLYHTSPDTTTVPAVAETVEFSVSTDAPTRIADVPVEPGQLVRAGDLLVVLDQALISQELAVVAAELEFAHAELAARAAELGRERLAEERTFAANVDAAEIELLQARVAADEARAELASVRAQERRWEGLVSQRMAAREELERLRAERTTLTRRVAVLDDAAKDMEAKVAAARARLEDFRETSPQSTEEAALAAASGAFGGGPDVLAPERAAVSVARARVAELEARQRRLLLRAPADGIVHRVLLRPGDVAAEGAPIVTLREPAPRRVLAYVDDARAAMLHVGTRVVVHDRSGSGRPSTGRIASLGGGLTPFPMQLQRGRADELWGREVVVELDPGETNLAAGQIVSVAFDYRRAGSAGTAAAASPDSGATPPPNGSVAAADAPRRVEIPPALRRRTRVEPSGLAWSAAHGAWLVASDDTGWPDEQEHAPWLLLLDPEGRLAPAPLGLEGVPKLNDVESLAWTPDGRLLLLSSQSQSKRGRRPAARTWLLAARPEGRDLRVVARASLAGALAAQSDPEFHAGLGLRPPEGGEVDPRLDIEGLAVLEDGALLLGLKEPLDDQGRALLWRLSGPEVLFETGRIAPDQLTLHARLRLGAGGGPAAGVSDLLRLPNGGLVVLSVDEDGGAASYVAPDTAPAADGELAVQPLRRFDGITPEGVAPTPAGDRLVVVFDRGEDTPLWTTLPLPTAKAPVATH